ncbi:caspase recruitment domain-containing protein 8 isoform X4 [Calonectris borealis]|uniref:caspase recruitment domain-containing protein 8 isoform X4 n=1 Tax=Calonectris borealis TaxID=1323832 RepID=UPI003F4B4AB7
MAEQQRADDSPDEFYIFIRTLSGKILTVRVSLDDSVRELKVKLNAQDSSLTPDRIRLIYRYSQLQDDLPLRHYGITPNCFLHLISRRSSRSDAGDNPRLFQGPHRVPVRAVGRSWSTFQKPCPTWHEPVVPPTCRAHLPGRGIFQCSITGLSFEVKSAVTITYRYATWTRHLSEADQETWMPAGPLFRIEVQPGVVRAVHLPHFICLAEGVNTSLCSVAHFKSGKMTLERPTRLIAFSAVLENPSFSLLGVLWRRLRSTLNSLPMHSLVLIFQQLSAASTTLHLYLIPDDNSVKQAIEKQEMNWNSKLIPKPSPFNPLFFGCVYKVTSTNFVVIMPEAHLPFCYKSPKEQQLFVEIYIREMAEEIGLLMTDIRNGTVVWRASLRSGDISLPAPVSKTFSGAAFMKKHKTELCSRMRQLSTILLHLRDANVINSDEEEEVQGQDTSHRRSRVLLELAEKKGLEAQEQLYQILRMKDPYLIADLEKSS